MYIELKTSSAFSFLEGASLPEELAQEASRLGYPSIALLDRDGLYGAPRFYKACREVGVRPLVGARLSLKDGSELALLVKDRTGYQNLSQLITRTKLTAPKGAGITDLDTIESFSKGLICLSGNGEGPIAQRILRGVPWEASRYLDRLVAIFGGKGVYIEIQRHLRRQQERLNQFLVSLSERHHLPLLASNGVLFAEKQNRPLQDVLTCIRHKTTLRQAGRLLSLNSERYLKPPREMESLFGDMKKALENTRRLSQKLEFTLENLGYQFPLFPLPPDETPDSYLRLLTLQGARNRYRPFSRKAQRQIEKELSLIEKLDLAGYFLIVWDIVQFCRKNGILAQGRGSAANSAVCYSLGITAVDPVGMDLLFERFLSEERGEWPDIDIDLPSGDRREKVIQYVYERYGQLGAAMTANVITYRARSAAREVAKVFEFPPAVIDRLSRLLTSWGPHLEEIDTAHFKRSGLDPSHERTRLLLKLWQQIQDRPRHLGQHSGGMVIARGRLDSVVPLENASMPGRRVIQWDKEDCADLGIIKVDLLGLGMMSALQDAIQLVRRHHTTDIDLARLPQDDPRVYELLCKADTVGLFQVESRAQMATLPRLKPNCFYDLVVEIAIIRPGPIVGQMVHPYLRRKAELEPVTYPHPSLKPILKRTLGVPIFQEQLLKIAMTVAGFSGGEAEELRRALGFKRSEKRMKTIEIKLREGMKKNGIVGETAEGIIRYISSFALYGFPESHSASFALIAYASAYMKVYFPAAFYASLLNNQPMGFYRPATLVKDAQRRGQRIRPISVHHSGWKCTIETDDSVRLGLLYVQGLREKAGRCIVEERRQRPFRDLEDLVRRCSLQKPELVTLAEIGALNGFGMKRRKALWQVEAAARQRGSLFHSVSSITERTSPLREMNSLERLQADYRGSRLTTGPHPMALLRRSVKKKGAAPASELPSLQNGHLVRVAGSVIVRQRPLTAKGFLFLSLEDETGISNIVVKPAVFKENRLILVSAPFLLVEGILQHSDNVVSILGKRFWEIEVNEVDPPSHDFH